ncbi:ABC transporter permease [Cohnella lubricantis]|uniref:ABC transporter permease n=1 Tax=Cohnella lubricantis TaxID=2163172 RepID=A0A841TF25_9BACL|nr:ABC transporter permease [Cohnella lubricantis]MBB6677071.1 ABC transporter permease [Cohnella lubricantis]MBP2118918.1 YhgE/Pip-like protein [Cohnella lubricantis]
MAVLKAFFKRPTTWIGIVTALMFQLIFSVVWMTGYDGVTDRMDRLHVGIVNEDAGIGAQVAEQLQSSLPVQTERFEDMDAARRRLDDRELQMIIRIPASFSADVSDAGKKASIQYVLNESNPATIKSMMTGVAEQVTATVNKMAVGQGIAQTLAQAQMPADQAQAAAGALSERVVSDIESIHPVKGMNNQMVPMMVVLASFVGAMIMGMNMEQSSMGVAMATGAGKWARFAARTWINIGAAFVVSLIGTLLVMAFGGQTEQGWLALWGVVFVVLLTFLFVTQMFLLLFGMGGMLFNVVTLSAQLVSSGAMVPRELLPDFYVGLGHALPATYAVNGLMNVLFGGGGLGESFGMLILIAAVAIAVGALAVALKPQKKPHAGAAPAGAAQR